MTEFERITQILQDLQHEWNTVQWQLMPERGYCNEVAYLEHRLRVLECEIVRYQSLQRLTLQKGVTS